MFDFAQVLMNYRERLKYSQADAARALNVPRATLTGWENGRGDPDDGTLTVLEGMMNFRPGELRAHRYWNRAEAAGIDPAIMLDPDVVKYHPPKDRGMQGPVFPPRVKMPQNGKGPPWGE